MNRRKLSFKWFGSLTNISTRRQTEKTTISSAAPRHDGSLIGAKSPALGGGRGGGGGGGGGGLVGDQSVDDMESCLRSPGYARSTDMYTHVGTVPRSQSQKKKKKKSRDKKKTMKEDEGEEEGGGGQIQWRSTGEHVRDSPLLGALSTLSLSGLERPTPAPPAPPAPQPASPPTSASGGGHQEDPPTSKGSSGAAEPVRDPIPAPGAPRPRASSQDLYVPMDPICEGNKQEATKTFNGSEAVAETHRLQEPTDSTGEYVKFSKEKFWLEPPTEKLRKQLEEELKLSSSNLKSHAWYHGPIPWEVSESLVVTHGDFLIRDSRSSQGDFVLTGRWDQKTLHFLVRRSVVQSSETYTRVRFSLEEEEAFDSLPALVHFYVGGRAALTRWSKAQIHRPVNRTLPLSYLEMAFSTAVSTPPGPGRQTQEGACPRSPSSLHQRETDANRDHDPSSLSTPYNNSPQSRSPSSSRAPSVAPSPSTSRRSDTAFPPPSPPSSSSSSSSSTLQRPQPPHLDQNSSHYSDGGGSCYTELYPGPPPPPSPPPLPQSYVERLRSEEEGEEAQQEEEERRNVYFSPVVETVTSFKPSRYSSPLMPAANKPLEVGILRRVKELLAEVEPRTAARHITKADCTVGRILEVTPEVQRMMGVSSGMELLTLPHGQQLRLDLLERFQTMATMLAVDVLGCTGTTEERAALLHKIIQIAAELKGTMGNMFGFAAVMRALELPQVSRLEHTWTALRQRHTEGAILYEKTLRPFMKSLNDGRESCPLSNTSFPHVLPLLTLLEKSTAVGEGAEPWETVEVGVDVVMFHLGAARTIAQLGGIYRSNADGKLQGFQEHPEVLELFLTDFQMRLLWGSRGAEESQALRYAKFDQVLTALSNKLEPPARPR